ncbi:MAG: TIGR01440 family protein [Bacillota bacterium]|nr:TIGR01440 family protein [Bacillota bacterium]
MDQAELNKISTQVREAVQGLLAVANMKQEQILVVGCSTSEVIGKKIGTEGTREVAEAILEPLLAETARRQLFLAIQCCEHLNRCLLVEEAAMERYELEQVTVKPVATAGGSLPALAYDVYQKPVLVENIKAHAGIDIGDTFIGMHLRPVAVPVRIELKAIGHAHLTLARTRPKLIGGQRAVYC